MNDRVRMAGWVMIGIILWIVVTGVARWVTSPDCSHLIAGSPAHDECEAGQ